MVLFFCSVIMLLHDDITSEALPCEFSASFRRFLVLSYIWSQHQLGSYRPPALFQKCLQIWSEWGFGPFHGFWFPDSFCGLESFPLSGTFLGGHDLGVALLSTRWLTSVTGGKGAQVSAFLCLCVRQATRLPFSPFPCMQLAWRVGESVSDFLLPPF